MKHTRIETLARRVMVLLATTMVVSLLTTSALAQDEGEPPPQLTLVSGVSGGSWYPIGAGISELFGRAGVNANTEQGGGVSNVIAVGQGDAELGFTTSIIPSLARAGEEPFQEPVTSVRGITVLWEDFTHVMVREDTGIDSVADLDGERFASQPVGTSTAEAFKNLLAAYDLTEDDLTLTRGGQGHGSDQVKDRNVVGLTATTAAPSGTLSEMATSVDMRVLGVDDAAFERLVEINPGFSRHTLEAGTYPGQEEDVLGVGTTTVLITHEDVPEEQVYWITKTLVESIADVNEIHASLADLTPEIMASVAGIDLHPGAERYYQEIGLLD